MTERDKINKEKNLPKKYQRDFHEEKKWRASGHISSSNSSIPSDRWDAIDWGK